MKKLISYLVVVLIASISSAQEITELKEAKVGFAPLTSSVERDGDSFSYKVHEAYAEEFEKDPLAFMGSYFDINNFITEVKREKYDAYIVNFISSRGKLKADFNKKGELVKSSSVFKNILLPEDLRERLYRENMGWVMVKNSHSVKGRNGLVTQDTYKIKLVNGKQRKNLVYEGQVKDSRVVSN